MSNDKTLATAKHGGRVQLGDWLPPLPKAGYVTGGDFGHEAHNAFTPEQMRDYARAALSAQPSPGGQGDALLREVSAQLESLDCGACIGSDAPMEDLHGRIAAHLASRQPVGEPVAVEIPQGAIINGAAFADRLEQDYQFECPAGPLVNCTDYVEFRRCFDFLAQWASSLPPLYAAPTAQAVGLEQFRPAVCAMGLYAEEPEEVDEAKRLLALIDSQAVGK